MGKFLNPRIKVTAPQEEIDEWDIEADRAGLPRSEWLRSLANRELADNPEKGGLAPADPRPIVRRFWKMVDKNGPVPEHMSHLGNCWVWTGHRAKKMGYGQLSVNGKPVGAHRVAWELAHGKPPAPMCLHRCDNGSCVRPGHLFEGSAQDNARDRVEKGRSRKKRT